MRAEFGRPGSIVRLRTWTATSTSVARRSSACKRFQSPITRLKRHLHRRAPSAQRAVVGHGEVEPEQAHDGADQPFGLAQGEPEHRPQGQGSQDGETRVGRLPTPGRPRLGLPGRDRLRGEPHRQTPAPAQTGVVVAPIRDLEPLPGDVVATVGIGFEGHGASQVRGPRLSDPGPLVPLIAGSLQQGRASGQDGLA